MTTTTTTPRTYSEAIKVAETVTVDEFEALLKGSTGVSVLRKRCPISHGYDFGPARPGYVGFEACSNRTGYVNRQIAFFDRSVFDFYQVGRLVRVAK